LRLKKLSISIFSKILQLSQIKNIAKKKKTKIKQSSVLSYHTASTDHQEKRKIQNEKREKKQNKTLKVKEKNLSKSWRDERGSNGLKSTQDQGNLKN
jgi:uncharacterized membrane protein